MSSNREPTTEEWFINAMVLRHEAKVALEALPKAERWGEYTTRYEDAIEDLDHALRRICNRLRHLAYDAQKRAETSKSPAQPPTAEKSPGQA
jgi:hypothetical protein